MRYVAERDGGWDALPRLLERCARGEGLFGEFLLQRTAGPGLRSLVADCTVANLVQDTAVADGRYGYVRQVAG